MQNKARQYWVNTESTNCTQSAIAVSHPDLHVRDPEREFGVARAVLGRLGARGVWDSRNTGGLDLHDMVGSCLTHLGNCDLTCLPAPGTLMTSPDEFL